ADISVNELQRLDERGITRYDPYQGYEGPHVDDAIAALHLEQHRRDQRVALGESGSRALFPGARFSLQGHTVNAFNRSWAVVAVNHEGSAPDLEETGDVVYRHRFRAVEGDQAYRPRRPK